MSQFKTAATAKIVINAPSAKIWDALTNPKIVKQYLSGAEIASDWQKGDPITYSGEWKGKAYKDKGTILEIEAGKLLKVTHYSPLSGLPDIPENYHIVTYALAGDSKEKTTLSITQENNKSQAEVDESEKTWNTVLGAIKTLLEK